MTFLERQLISCLIWKARAFWLLWNSFVESTRAHVLQLEGQGEQPKFSLFSSTEALSWNFARTKVSCKFGGRVKATTGGWGKIDLRRSVLWSVGICFLMNLASGGRPGWYSTTNGTLWELRWRVFYVRICWRGVLFAFSMAFSIEPRKYCRL